MRMSQCNACQWRGMSRCSKLAGCSGTWLSARRAAAHHLPPRPAAAWPFPQRKCRHATLQLRVLRLLCRAPSVAGLAGELDGAREAAAPKQAAIRAIRVQV